MVKYLVGPLLRRVNLRPHKPYHGVPDLTVSVPTVGAIIFETLSLVSVTSERVSKIMAPTVVHRLEVRGGNVGPGVLICVYALWLCVCVMFESVCVEV